MPNTMTDTMDGAAASLMDGQMTIASSNAMTPPNAVVSPKATTPAASAPWPGDDAALDRVRESLRAARQQVEGAVAVLRERGALNMDATEAFTRARTLCRRAERRLAGACGVLAPRPGDADRVH